MVAILISLLGWESEGLQQCYTLDDKEQFAGRLPTCQIQTQSPSVSRMHARIYKKDDLWMIEDLRSLNGIAINGRRVHHSPLQYGEILQIGKLFFVLADMEESQISDQTQWLAEINELARQHEQISELFPSNHTETPPPVLPVSEIQAPQAMATPVVNATKPAATTYSSPTHPLTRKKSTMGHPTPAVLSALPATPAPTQPPPPALTPAETRTAADNNQLKVKSDTDWTLWIILGVAVLAAIAITIWKITSHAPAAH